MKIDNIFKKIRSDADISNSSDIINDFMIDSFDLVLIVEEIEKEFNIKFDITDIKRNNFKTKESIINLIKNKGGNIWTKI